MMGSGGKSSVIARNRKKELLSSASGDCEVCLGHDRAEAPERESCGHRGGWHSGMPRNGPWPAVTHGTRRLTTLAPRASSRHTATNAFDVDRVHEYRGRALPSANALPDPLTRGHPTFPIRKLARRKDRAHGHGSEIALRPTARTAASALGAAPADIEAFHASCKKGPSHGTLLMRSGGSGRGHARSESPPHLVRCSPPSYSAECRTPQPQFRHKTLEEKSRAVDLAGCLVANAVGPSRGRRNSRG